MSGTTAEQVARMVASFDDPALYGICPANRAPEDEQLFVLDDRTFRPLSKAQLAPLQIHTEKPLDLRFVNVLEDLWKQLDALDALKTALSVDLAMKDTMIRIVRDPVLLQEFLTTAAEAYVDYMAEGAKGTLTMFLLPFKVLFELAGWQDLAQRLTVEAIVAAADPSKKIDFAELVAKASAEKPELVPLVSALAQMAEMFQIIRSQKYVAFAIALELMAEALVTLMELLNEAKIRELLIKSANDHQLIAKYSGTIIGFVVWDIVIDELMTLGLGKATRFVRHVVVD